MRSRPARAARVEVAGYPEPVEGTVRLVEPTVDEASRLGKVKIALPADKGLRPGLFARGRIETARREGVVAPQSALLYGAEGARVQVVADGLVSERRGQDRPAATIAASRSCRGVADGDEVVARAGGFLRDGDRITPVRRQAATADRRAGARLDGAQRLRLGDPQADPVARAVRGADSRSGLRPSPRCRSRACRTSTCRSSRSPSAQAGAAPSELEMQVTKQVETAVAGLSGVKHITSTSATASRSRPSSSSSRPQVDRAVNDVSDAVTKIRTELPHSIEEPLIQRIDIEGMPIVDLCGLGAVDDAGGAVLVHRRPGDPRSCSRSGASAQVKREGGVDREIRVSLDPGAAAGARRHRGRRQPPAPRHQRRPRGRARRDRHAGAVDPHARGRAHRRRSRRRHASCCRAAAQAPLAELGTVRDGSAEPRIFGASSTASRSSPSGSTAPRAISDVVGRRRPPTRSSQSSQAARPDVDDHAGSTRRCVHRGRLQLRDAHAARGRGARGLRGVPVPARLARHHHHRARDPAVDPADLLGDAARSASR